MTSCLDSISVFSLPMNPANRVQGKRDGSAERTPVVHPRRSLRFYAG